jgi:hypothetical protein
LSPLLHYRKFHTCISHLRFSLQTLTSPPLVRYSYFFKGAAASPYY